MVPFWVPITIRSLIFRVPQKGNIILITTHIIFKVYDYDAAAVTCTKAGTTATATCATTPPVAATASTPPPVLL